MNKQQAQANHQINTLHAYLCLLAGLNSKMVKLQQEAATRTVQNCKRFHVVNKWNLGASVIVEDIETTHEFIDQMVNGLSKSNEVAVIDTSILARYLELVNTNIRMWREYAAAGIVALNTK